MPPCLVKILNQNKTLHVSRKSLANRKAVTCCCSVLIPWTLQPQSGTRPQRTAAVSSQMSSYPATLGSVIRKPQCRALPQLKQVCFGKTELWIQCITLFISVCFIYWRREGCFETVPHVAQAGLYLTSIWLHMNNTPGLLHTFKCGQLPSTHPNFTLLIQKTVQPKSQESERSCYACNGMRNMKHLLQLCAHQASLSYFPGPGTFQVWTRKWNRTQNRVLRKITSYFTQRRLATCHDPSL